MFAQPAFLVNYPSRTWRAGTSSIATLPFTHAPRLFLNQPKPSSRSSQRTALIVSSTQVPSRFNSVWYNESVSPMDIDVAAFHIRASECQTDFHFIDEPSGLMAIIDYPILPIPESVSSHHPGEDMSSHLKRALLQNRPLCKDMPVLDLTRILKIAMRDHSVPASFSGILIDASTNILRFASVGACGLLLIRDDRIHYRSYPHTATALINHLSPPPFYDSSDGGISDQFIHSDFVELQENDLVLAGSDGLFANLTDLQILAFVRPVPDKLDRTLSIANNTCLGSWTSDDVNFISYYLANLANNFATAVYAPSILRYPFPPSPHCDDVTVLSASFSHRD